VSDYEQTLSEPGSVGLAVNPNIRVVTQMMSIPTSGGTRSRLRAGNFFGYSLGHYYVFGSIAGSTTSVR